MQHFGRMARRAVIGVAAAAAFAGLATVAVAQTTLEKVKEQGFIRVGFANEAPYSYATSDGKLTGESPAVFKYVMKELGVDEVDGVLTEWASLIPNLKAGRFDAIVASMYVTPKRCEQIIFSNPTYGIGQAFLVKNGNPDGFNVYEDAVDKDKSIALVDGTAAIEHAKLVGLERDNRLIVPDFASAVDAVKSGRASAAALTSLTAKHLASKDDAIERAEPFTFTHDGKTYRGEGAFGFREADTALRDAVNGVLAKFIGTDKHLEMVEEFGFDEANLPELTAADHCAGK